MSTITGDDSSKDSRVDYGGSDVIDAYTGALTHGDADAALASVSPDSEFHSPFRVWGSRHVPSVFRARCIAFENFLVSSVLRDRDQAVILWNATVNGTQVEGAELVSVSDGVISHVDVFLRPAGVLDAVHKAMVDAWP